MYTYMCLACISRIAWMTKYRRMLSPVKYEPYNMQSFAFFLVLSLLHGVRFSVSYSSSFGPCFLLLLLFAMFHQPTYVPFPDGLRDDAAARASATHGAVHGTGGRGGVLGVVFHRGNRVLHRAAVRPCELVFCGFFPRLYSIGHTGWHLAVYERIKEAFWAINTPLNHTKMFHTLDNDNKFSIDSRQKVYWVQYRPNAAIDDRQ